jgi:hypothetical protein
MNAPAQLDARRKPIQVEQNRSILKICRAFTLHHHNMKLKCAPMAFGNKKTDRPLARSGATARRRLYLQKEPIEQPVPKTRNRRAMG